MEENEYKKEVAHCVNTCMCKFKMPATNIWNPSCEEFFEILCS